MKKKNMRLLSLLLVAALLFGLLGTSALAATTNNPKNYTTITNLRVDEQTEPLNVEPKDDAPLDFSWEMASTLVGQKQTAYRIVVTDEAGASVWDSGKVVSEKSTDVAYAGSAFTADTRYDWALTVWDAYGNAYSGSSFFETSLLSQSQDAWNGAQFIGVKKLILDADSMLTFDLSTDFQIKSGSTASIVFGANDFRLNESFQNKWKLSGDNYIRAEINISELAEGSGSSAYVSLYAPGYGADNTATKPVYSAVIEGMTAANMRDVHTLKISVSISKITVKVTVGDKSTEFSTTASSNFHSGDHNYNTFPHLNDIGFAARQGDLVEYTNYSITTRQDQGGNQTVMSDTAGATYTMFNDYDTYVSGNGAKVTAADGKITVSGGAAPAAGTTYTVATSCNEGGTVTPSLTIKEGKKAVVTITPDDDHVVGDVTVDDVSVGAVTTYTLTNVTADHTVAVTFKAKAKFTLTVSAGDHGSITPTGTVTVNEGDSQKFTITSESGYKIKEILLDGAAVEKPTRSYALKNISANHTIAVSFEEGSGDGYSDDMILATATPSAGGGTPVFKSSWPATAKSLTWTMEDTSIAGIGPNDDSMIGIDGKAAGETWCLGTDADGTVVYVIKVVVSAGGGSQGGGGFPGGGGSSSAANVDVDTDNLEALTLVTHADPSYNSQTMLRKEFTASKQVKSAKLYATAMGDYDLEINGKNVSPDTYFEPGFSMYRESLYYNAYDVSDLVKQGGNAIGATLGSGWYTGYMTYSVEGNYSLWGDYEGLMAMLVITYADGTKDYVVTDTSWEGCKDGPVRYASFYQGENYDASKEAAVEDCFTVGYDASKWTETVSVIDFRDWIANNADWGLYARQDAPVHLYETLNASRVCVVNDAANGTFTYDMGVDMVGIPQVTFPTTGMNVGDKVVFRYAEQLFPGREGEMNCTQKWIDIYGDNATGTGAGLAGRIMTDTYRGAYATDTYAVSAADIKAGHATYTPTFTYRGYRYIQITVPGTTEALALDSVKGLVLTSSENIKSTYNATANDTVTDAYGNASTTGAMATQLFKNITRSQLGNFFTIPTDCPQRNERMGWTGDAQAYSLMSTYVSDTVNFWSTWMQSLKDSQSTDGGIGSTCPDYGTTRGGGVSNGTTWAAAVCMVPWNVYSQYGDTTIVTEYADTMFKWLDGMSGNRLTAAMATEDAASYLAANKDTYSFSDTYKNLRSGSVTSGLCDWLARDGADATVVNNAIYTYMVEVASIMFKAVGDKRADVLSAYHDLIKEEWNQAFVDKTTGMTYNSDMKTYDDSQTSYASPLNYNVFSDKDKVTVDGTEYTYRQYAAKRLSELVEDPNRSGNGTASGYDAYTITTGFSGTANILDALTANGYANTAYKLFQSTKYASWLYPVVNGATTMYERWNSYDLAFEDGIGSDNSMNSFNHFALGAAGSWMFEYQLGITSGTRSEDSASITDGGYQNFILQPTVGGTYTALNGSYQSDYGAIKSSWTASDDKMTSLSAVVPANTSATLYLPTAAAKDKVAIPESLADYVTYVGTESHNGTDCTMLRLASGGYDFTVSDSGVTVAKQNDYVLYKAGSSSGSNSGGSSAGNTTDTETNCPSAPYSDLSRSAWYHEYVDAMLKGGYMTGTSATGFSPSAATNRAMVVTILYRYAKANVSYAASFRDVAAGLWYSEPVTWAAGKNVVNGFKDGSFRPGDPVTREQLAAILYRYAGSPETSGSLSAFKDADSVSSYAISAVKWCVSKGILAGYADGTLRTAGNATRAEMAKMISVFIKVMEG